MNSLKKKIISQRKSDEKKKVILDNESDIIEAPKRKWLTKDEKAAKRLEMKELRKKCKEEQERKKIVHDLVNSVIENIITQAELAKPKCIYIRPKIRTQNTNIQRSCTSMYIEEQLEKMKDTRVGDIINSIYNQNIPKKRVVH